MIAWTPGPWELVIVGCLCAMPVIVGNTVALTVVALNKRKP